MVRPYQDRGDGTALQANTVAVQQVVTATSMANWQQEKI